VSPRADNGDAVTIVVSHPVELPFGADHEVRAGELVIDADLAAAHETGVAGSVPIQPEQVVVPLGVRPGGADVAADVKPRPGEDWRCVDRGGRRLERHVGRAGNARSERNQRNACEECFLHCVPTFPNGRHRRPTGWPIGRLWSQELHSHSRFSQFKSRSVSEVLARRVFRITVESDADQKPRMEPRKAAEMTKQTTIRDIEKFLLGKIPRQ